MSIDLNSSVSNRTLYVTQDGNVFKSTDDGASWFLVLNNGGLKFTAVDRFNSQSTWTETGLAEMRNQQSGTAFRDDIVPTFEGNGEKVWNGVFEIKADPTIPNRVYAIPNRVYVTAYGANKGMYRSDDGGVNWTKLYTDNFMRGFAIHPSNSNLLRLFDVRRWRCQLDGNKFGYELAFWWKNGSR